MDALTAPKLVARKNIFNFWHQWFQIMDPQGNILLYTKMRAFKLREDIRILGPDKQTEIVTMRARQILDFGVTYDVRDGATGAPIGAFRRKGIKSIFKDEWLILDTADQEVGMIQEDSGGLAFLRRFLGGIVNLFAPQQHHGRIGQRPVLTFQQTRNPFVTKTYLDFSMDGGGLLDRRMGLAAAVLFCAIEGKQD
ncbi:hypothetical protein [Haloferula sp. A504]|uniref:hypothetical protein n=1 Tax=Haloferula sp. A504 TaxID=3373601 RepID=UPI0031BC6138|nr:hypothetical protein [Verrucomicrobiaceae bacterium E54]